MDEEISPIKAFLSPKKHKGETEQSLVLSPDKAREEIMLKDVVIYPYASNTMITE